MCLEFFRCLEFSGQSVVSGVFICLEILGL